MVLKSDFLPPAGCPRMVNAGERLGLCTHHHWALVAQEDDWWVCIIALHLCSVNGTINPQVTQARNLVVILNSCSVSQHTTNSFYQILKISLPNYPSNPPPFCVNASGYWLNSCPHHSSSELLKLETTGLLVFGLDTSNPMSSGRVVFLNY